MSITSIELNGVEITADDVERAERGRGRPSQGRTTTGPDGRRHWDRTGRSIHLMVEPAMKADVADLAGALGITASDIVRQALVYYLRSNRRTIAEYRQEHGAQDA